MIVNCTAINSWGKFVVTSHWSALEKIFCLLTLTVSIFWQDFWRMPWKFGIVAAHFIEIRLCWSPGCFENLSFRKTLQKQLSDLEAVLLLPFMDNRRQVKGEKWGEKDKHLYMWLTLKIPLYLGSKIRLIRQFFFWFSSPVFELLWTVQANPGDFYGFL